MTTIGHNSVCSTCAGSGAFVATQQMDERMFYALQEKLGDVVMEALRDAAPMPAIITCPGCSGTGEERSDP